MKTIKAKTKMGRLMGKTAVFGAAAALLFLSACSNLTDVRLPAAKSKISGARLSSLSVNYVLENDLPVTIRGLSISPVLQTLGIPDTTLTVELTLSVTLPATVEYAINDTFDHITSPVMTASGDGLDKKIEVDMSYRFETNVYLYVERTRYTVRLLKSVPSACYYVSANGDGQLPVDDERGGPNRGKTTDSAFFSLKHAVEQAKLTDVRVIYIVGELTRDHEVDPAEDALFVIDGTNEHFIRIRAKTAGGGILNAGGSGKRVLNVNRGLVLFTGVKITGGGSGASEKPIREGGGVKITGDMESGEFLPSSVTFADCIITQNSVHELGRGGGVYIESSFVKFTNTVVSENESNMDGGGIYATAKDGNSPVSRVTISDGSVLKDNRTITRGGGAFIGGAVIGKGSHLTVSGSDITGNTVKGGYGGGIYVGGDNVPKTAAGYTLVLDSAKVYENKSGLGFGSGVYFCGSLFEFKGDSKVGRLTDLTLQQIEERNFGDTIEMPQDRQLTVDITVPESGKLAAVVETAAPAGTQVLIGSGIPGNSDPTSKRFARFRPLRAEAGVYYNYMWGYDKTGTLYKSNEIFVADSGGSDNYDGLSPETAYNTFERACVTASAFTYPAVKIKGYLGTANHGVPTDADPEKRGWTASEVDNSSLFTLAFKQGALHDKPISISGVDNASGFKGDTNKRALAISEFSDLKVTGNIAFSGTTGFAADQGSAFSVAPAAKLTVTADINAPDFSILNNGILTVGDVSSTALPLTVKMTKVISKKTATVHGNATLEAFFDVTAGSGESTADIKGGTLAKGGKVTGTSAKKATATFGPDSLIKGGAFTATTANSFVDATGDFAAENATGRIVLESGSKFVLKHKYSGILDVQYGAYFGMGNTATTTAKVGGKTGDRVWLGRKADATDWAVINLVGDVGANAATVYIGRVGVKEVGNPARDDDPTSYYNNGEKYDNKRPIVKLGTLEANVGNDPAKPKFKLGNETVWGKKYWHIWKDSNNNGALSVDSNTGAYWTDTGSFNLFTNVLSGTDRSRSTQNFVRVSNGSSYIGWREIYTFHSAGTYGGNVNRLGHPKNAKIHFVVIGGGGGGGGGESWVDNKKAGGDGGNGGGGGGVHETSTDSTTDTNAFVSITVGGGGGGGGGETYHLFYYTGPWSGTAGSGSSLSIEGSSYIGGGGRQGYHYNSTNKTGTIGSSSGTTVPHSIDSGFLNTTSNGTYITSNFSSISTNSNYTNGGKGGVSTSNGGENDGRGGSAGWVILHVEYPVTN